MADHNIKLDPGAAALLDALHGAGYAAYAVGGCVRDSLLGLTPHDWDLCTSALPRQVLDRFGKEQCIPTGLQHGTVTVKYGGKLYETTTFRTEGSYSDGRHPDSVAFVPDVKEDLARRDFTINAMAYSAEEGLIDPFGGQKDLARGLVRAVGVPHQRFTEDALRILRLYRFAARFGFEIDPATGQAARELCAHLDCVSTERITEELTRLLAAPKPGTWMEPAVFAVVLPELFTPENAPRFEAARAIIDTLPEGLPEVSARLAALLLPLGEQGTRKALKQLRCSNALIEEVTTLVREAGLVPEEKTAARAIQARRLLGRLEPDPLRRLLALRGPQAGTGGCLCGPANGSRPAASGKRLLPGGAIGRQWPGPDGAGRKARPGPARTAGGFAGSRHHGAAPQRTESPAGSGENRIGSVILHDLTSEKLCGSIITTDFVC